MKELTTSAEHWRRCIFLDFWRLIAAVWSLPKNPQYSDCPLLDPVVQNLPNILKCSFFVSEPKSQMEEPNIFVGLVAEAVKSHNWWTGHGKACRHALHTFWRALCRTCSSFMTSTPFVHFQLLLFWLWWKKGLVQSFSHQPSYQPCRVFEGSFSKRKITRRNA